MPYWEADKVFRGVFFTFQENFSWTLTTLPPVQSRPNWTKRTRKEEGIYINSVNSVFRKRACSLKRGGTLVQKSGVHFEEKVMNIENGKRKAVLHGVEFE